VAGLGELTSPPRSGLIYPSNPRAGTARCPTLAKDYVVPGIGQEHDEAVGAVLGNAGRPGGGSELPGITGMIGPGEPGRREADLRQMVQSLMHEPSYAAGTFVHEPLGLWLGWANHRGSFSDCQPIWNEAHDICLIFTGEDFTTPEDIRALRTAGHDFTPGNASYLVHLYEDRDEGFLEALNGRFSGALVDLRRRRCVLFNDRFGLNRIYFVGKNDGFYFSSEAKSLLAVSPELRSLDYQSLAETFSCGAVMQNRTLFSRLSLLPGGSAWTFSPGEDIRKNIYFKPETWEKCETLSGPEYYRALKETWIRVLPRYFQGGEPAAVSLTGGKDSRMIMAWAVAPPGGLPCYTFSGAYRECEDVRLARRVATISGQPHSVIPVDAEFLGGYPKWAERTVYLSDGTMDVSGSVELYVNRIARQIAPVRLSGNYGQEILRRSVAFKPAPVSGGFLRREFAGLVERAAATYGQELGGNRLSFVAFKQMPWHHYSRLSIELSQLTLRSPFLDNDIVSLAYQVPRKLEGDVGIQLRLIAEGNPALGDLETDRGFSSRSITPLDWTRHLARELTVKAEYAYDYGMPQWLATVDHLFRAFRLERLFLGRHKFYHFRIWYRRELVDYIKSVLLDPRALNRPYLDGGRVERLVTAHARGTRNYTSEIHRLLTAELFQRQFTD